ncbi:hypothetical protein A2U10_08760 [Fusobacterium necrophorum subsp. funduliforme]|uniref:PF04286 domain protein n=4 Tax=Fusobacterium necrophorum TaxID=859 RepID=A0AAN3VXI9_9FUSO|nr:DUF445 family protein [Fusobacterium necrophorum]AVQ20218.1 DUF445 domain-containing protein [Fusobacterium necrophorum subsp. funduliforme]AYV93757.1 DUF445 family protein [Fusobacterium necrophorum subsp. funduliforme]AYV95923.1 DUF445 family protein [Fusobacterium necrophorum subsp. funduliforme]AYZ73775.1 DUF445 family protein [Fusobacterium necrophorum]AZW08218.1 DUF445 family protein [Fusobacterium necrophorum subsp. necrophorum]
MLLRWLMMVLIGAWIGWITNWLAIKMLFHPYEEKRFLCFRIQGVIPKRKKDIGSGIARVVEQELLSLRELLEQMDTELIFRNIEKRMDEYLEENLEKEIQKAFPFAAMFLGKDSLEKIKALVKQGVLSRKEEICSAFTSHLEENIDIQKMISDKIASFSFQKVEEIIFSLAKKELKHIEWVGAVLGAVIGGLQFLLFSYFS